MYKTHSSILVASFAVLGLLSCDKKKAVKAEAPKLNTSKAQVAKVEAPISDVSREAFSPMENESIGPLKIGMGQNNIETFIQIQPNRGKQEEWEHIDGCFHQEWDYKELGIQLGMVSDQEDSLRTIEQIYVTSPCAFATTKGIRIGSSEEDVKKAYGLYCSDESEPGKTYIAGNIYDGITFTLDKGRVISIFLGGHPN